jgi:hypothetical protein
MTMEKKVWVSPVLEELGIEKTLGAPLYNPNETIITTPFGPQISGPSGSLVITKK